jgi:uncharacterized membrane protein
MSAEDQRSRVARYIGLVLAGLGLAHFTNPTLFDPLTSQAFSNRTRQHTYVDGAVETALGLGLAGRRTRRLATVGSMGYLAYLGRSVRRKTF